MYNKLFDLNRDGELDAAERALEYMAFRAAVGEEESDDEESDDEDFDFEE